MLQGLEGGDELAVERHPLHGDGPGPPDVVQEPEHPLPHPAVHHNLVLAGQNPGKKEFSLKISL